MQKFNVGDKVKITGEGSKEGWVDEMEDYVGKIGNVTIYDSRDNSYQVEFPDTLVLWWYKPDNLELVEPAVKVVQPQVVTNNTTSELLTIEQAIHLLKSNGYKVYKEL